MFFVGKKKLKKILSKALQVVEFREKASNYKKLLKFKKFFKKTLDKPFIPVLKLNHKNKE